MIEEIKTEVVAPVVEASVEEDKLALVEAELEKAKEDRDNYKAVALKRLGKLPNDAEFMGEGSKDIDALIAEKVQIALMDKEVSRKETERLAEIDKIRKENVELRLALKNQPGKSVGGSSGGGMEVKDNVFTPDQILKMHERATKLKIDPVKYVESAKKNLQSRQ